MKQLINICFGYKLLNLVNSKGTSHKSKINILNIQTEYKHFLLNIPVYLI